MLILPHQWLLPTSLQYLLAFVRIKPQPTLSSVDESYFDSIMLHCKAITIQTRIGNSSMAKHREIPKVFIFSWASQHPTFHFMSGPAQTLQRCYRVTDKWVMPDRPEKQQKLFGSNLIRSVDRKQVSHWDTLALYSKIKLLVMGLRWCLLIGLQFDTSPLWWLI